jgi:cytochrome P450
MVDPQRSLGIQELVADPIGTLARARDEGAIVATDIGLLVTRHEAARAILQDDERFQPSFTRSLHQLGVTSGPFYEWMGRSPLDMGGEEHRRWRKLMVRTFTPKSVDALRPFLRTEAERLIDGFVPERVEFVSEFARVLPSLGICELIGVPAEDRERFGVWADTIGLGFNPILLPQRIGDIDEAITALLDYSVKLAELRRREPRDDLVSRLAVAAAEEGIEPSWVQASIAGLVFAGHETTKNQLGWMITVLSEAGAEWDRVAAEPASARAAVEEVLRLRGTATNVGRLALEDVEVFGRSISQGTALVVSLWSSNRDAAVFPSPDRFDPAANGAGAQIAFGQGAHHCLGAALARAELQESLIALATRFTCPELLPGAEFLPPIGINGPTLLPLRFRRREP